MFALIILLPACHDPYPIPCCYCRFCLQGEGVSELAITASKNALELAGVDGADIDLVRLGDTAVSYQDKSREILLCDGVVLVVVMIVVGVLLAVHRWLSCALTRYGSTAVGVGVGVGGSHVGLFVVAVACAVVVSLTTIPV